MSPKWFVLGAVACGAFMATLDASIVTIALPTLTKDLGTDLIHIKWTVVLYSLIITCTLLPFGRISDIYGRKQLFTAGFVTFTIGSILCAVAESLSSLLIFRAIQAIGASMLMANGPALIAASFPANERGAALGSLAMSVSIGLISGPSIGGLLIAEWGWRSIFFVNVPIGILGMILVERFAKKDQKTKAHSDFDWLGTALQSFILVSFIWLVDPSSETLLGIALPLHTRWALAFLILFVLGAAFVQVEKKVKAPIFDLSLLKNRTFWSANLSGFLFFVAYSSISVLMPFFLEDVLQFPTDTAGLIMTIVPLTILFAAPIAGRLSDRLGSKELCILGSFLLALSLVLMSGDILFSALGGVGIRAGMGIGAILGLLSITGLAMGIFQSPNNNAIMGAVPHEKLGVASALIAMVRNLGLVIGASFSTGVFNWKFDLSGEHVTSLQFTFLVGGAIGLGALVASFGKNKGPHWKI